MKKTRIICLICAIVMVLGTINAFAINSNTLYDGSNKMSIDGGKTHTDPSGNTVANMVLNQVNGVMGKAAGDKVYEYTGFSDSSGGGSDYIGFWPNDYGNSYVLQTQLCITNQTNTVDYQIGYFPIPKADNANNATYKNGNIFRINADSGKMYVYTGTGFIDSDQEGKTIATLKKNRWYNIDVVITAGTSYITVYVDGEPYVINFRAKDASTGEKIEVPIHGMRHFRISTGKGYKGTGSSTSDVPFLAYLDNVSFVKNASYNEDDDKKASLVSDTYAISSDNVITLDSIDASAEEVLSHVTADSSKIRLFSDSTMKTQITGDMGITEGSVLAVAKVVDSQETAYNYYTFTFPGAESGMNSGTQKITLSEGGNVSDPSSLGSNKYPLSSGYTQAIEHGVPGTGGKKISDTTYFWGGKTCGSGGHWYLNLAASSAAKPAYIFEIAFKLDAGSSGFAYGPAPFVKDADGNTTSVFPNTYPFIFSFEKGAYLENATSSNLTPYSKDGKNNVFAQDSRGIKFGDIIPGRWHTFTMVTYADGTSKSDVYFDGVKTEINWNFNPAHMRHVRMYTFASDTQKLYFDNFKAYAVTIDDAKAYVQRDQKPQVEFIGYDVKDGEVSDILFGTRIADIKNSIVANGNVRIYKDDTFTELAADSDEVKEGMMVVASAKNGTAYDRTFAYYKLSLANDYDELTAYTRVTDLAINEENDKYYVSFNAKNLNSINNEALDMTVAVALYDEEDTLLDIAFGSASVAFGEPVAVTKSDDISIKKAADAKKVRAFVWWGDSQKPFSDAAVLDIK